MEHCHGSDQEAGPGGSDGPCRLPARCLRQLLPGHGPGGRGKYYTKDVDDVGKAGAVRFKDERTGSVVTLQNSQVRPISKDRYKEGTTEH